ncbi:MAG: Bordetella phage vB BbrM [Acidobacteriota bacterium]
MTDLKILQGDCVQSLKQLADESVQCCVTSPPYFGLRDYGHDGQIGLEPTPDDYVAKIVEVFREVRRMLRKDGTLWLNLGDSYARQGGRESNQPRHWDGREQDPGSMHGTRQAADIGLKPKDLIGIPWRVAFALQADGWYLRQDIIWHKPNPMPESVQDRCTKAHEYVFLLSKSDRYYYDAGAIEEEASQPDRVRSDKVGGNKYIEGIKHSDGSTFTGSATRNKRSVWTINTQPFKGAHFATFPVELPRLCILAGTKAGDVVLDPFGGSGTTGQVALELGRSAILCELNPEYVELIRQRCTTTIGLPL